MNTSTEFEVDVGDIRAHYDRLSFLYRLFWGEHLHHGYWDDDETPAQAQIQLMERLAERADIAQRASVLDIGCGLGGSAFWLNERFDCDVMGITISPVQARMANRKAKARGLSARVRFRVEDANKWEPEPASVDVIWIMESSEHFEDKKAFFERCALCLKPGGVLAVCAWLRRDGALQNGEERLVATIAQAMLSASLDGLSDYNSWMREAGLNVTTAEDITAHVSPTWEHCNRIAERRAVKFLVRFTGTAIRRFVASFPLMKQAYDQGAMAFGLFVARKPS
jgi:tocopherol O-methyltransferase